MEPLNTWWCSTEASSSTKNPVLLPGLDRKQAVDVGLVCPVAAVRDLERELQVLVR